MDFLVEAFCGMFFTVFCTEPDVLLSTLRTISPAHSLFSTTHSFLVAGCCKSC